MSVVLLAGRKKAVQNRKEKKQIRKVGCDFDGGFTCGEETASWDVKMDGRVVKISFSRDTTSVLVDGENVEVMAYLDDDDYDVDLLFDAEGHKGHIYSDVEGTEMTNYLFLDDKLIGRKSVSDCVSRHRPRPKTKQAHK